MPERRTIRDAVDVVHDTLALAGHRVPRRTAEAIMDDLIGAVGEWLDAGDRVTLTGLGTLSVQTRPARLLTTAFGAPLAPHRVIAARRQVTFRDGAALRRRLNPGL